MKILFMILSIASCSFLGVYFSNRYIKRDKLFSDTCTLLEKLKTNVAFSKNELSREIYSALSTYDGELYDILKSYYILLSGCEVIDYNLVKGSIKCRLLKSNELELYCQMLSMLGKSHAAAQLDELDFFMEQARGLHAAATLDREKYVGMYRKLGVYLGIGFAIFFL